MTYRHDNGRRRACHRNWHHSPEAASWCYVVPVKAGAECAGFSVVQFQLPSQCMHNQPNKRLAVSPSLTLHSCCPIPHAHFPNPASTFFIPAPTTLSSCHPTRPTPPGLTPHLPHIVTVPRINTVADPCFPRSASHTPPYPHPSERELAAVKVAAADVEVLAVELEMDKKAAERSLREAGGDLRRALEAYLGLQAAA